MIPAGYRIVISPRALADLEGIHNHIATDSPQNADKVCDVLIKAFWSLQELPTRFRVCSVSRKTKLETHVMVVRPYLVYYQVLEDRHAVRIATIRHGARRQPRSFN